MTRAQVLKIKKRRQRKRFFIAFLVVSGLFFVGTSIKFSQKTASDVVEAGDLSESILLMSEKSAINMAFEHEKVLMEEERLEKARIEYQQKKQIEEEQKQQEMNKKIAYLTFDDGPSKITPEILDVLKNYDVKATFFVIGNLAEQNSDTIRRMYEEGHAIGNHSYSHRYKTIYKNTTNFLNELKTTEKVLKNILGEEFETKIIRFPGGSFGNKKAAFRKAVVNNGYSYYDWNALNGDAEGHNIPKNKLVQRLKNTSNGQKKLIVLMHDMGAKKTTVAALPEIIEYLQQSGYEFDVLK